MRSSQFLKVFAFFLFPVVCVRPFHALDWPPILPEEQALTSVPQQAGAPAVILLRQETNDDRLHVQSVYMRIKILTEAGRKYGDVELPYNRRGFTIEQISGRTVHADGSVVPFEGKPFDKVVFKGRTRRIHVKAFSLPDVQPGSILDFRYNLRYGDNSLHPPEWLIQDELFQKKVSFKFIPYITRSNTFVIADHGRTATGVAWTPLLPPGHEPKVDHKIDGSNDVTLEMDDVAPLVEEPYMPPFNPWRWRVQFYYQVELKADEYWKKQGKFWNKDIEGFLNRRKGLSEALATLVTPSDTPEAKVRKIYAFVAGLENLSYTPSRTKQEDQTLGFKPNEGADDVLRQRSGSHDDLNRLFAAMVREAGIPAHMMWVSDRGEEYFNPSFMSTSQLDAEIVVVQLDGKDVFLDPGSKYCPYGILSWHYSGSRGLRQNDKDVEISTSDEPNYKQALIKRVAKLSLTDQGTMQGSVAVGYIGLEGMIRRREGNLTDAEGRKKMLEEEMRSWLPGGTEVTLSNSPDWDSTETMLVAQFRVSGPLALSAGKRWIVSAHVFQAAEKPLFSSAERTNIIYFDFPSREIDEVHITVPPDVTVENLPPEADAKVDYAIYQAQESREGQGILATRDLAMAGYAFEAKGYKTLKDFYDKVKAGDDEPVVLTSSHAQGN